MMRSNTKIVDASAPTDAQLLVLASLDDGPKHGHAMRTVIQHTFGKTLGPGALYGAINRLAAKGWIVPLPQSARRQPYEITESGRAYLRQSLALIRRLAESGPTEDKQVPSYYSNVDNSVIEGELAVEALKPPAYDPLFLPFGQLGGRRFEILTYLLQRNDEGDQGIVSLVKASGDGGRDVLVHRLAKLAKVIQCKNLSEKLSLLAIQEELLKLVLHDYRERFIPEEGITYELWAPGGLSDAAEKFVTTGQRQFAEETWADIFNRLAKKYKKLSSLQWDEVRQHVQLSLVERINILPYEGIALTQKVQSAPELCSRFFTVLNVWRKDDVEQVIVPQLQQIGVRIDQLTTLAEGAKGDEIDEQINEARDLINQGEFTEAQAALRHLERKKGHLFSNRQQFRVISNQGAIAFSQNRLDDAAQCFLRAVRLEPADERAKENEVLAYYLLREFEKAHRLATQRKRELPTSARVAGLWVNTAPATTPIEDLEAGVAPTLLEHHEVAIAIAQRCMALHLLEKAHNYVASAKISMPKWWQPWLVSAQIAIGKLLEENGGMRQIAKEDRPQILQDGIDAATKAIELCGSDGNWAKAEALIVRSQLHLMRDDLAQATFDARAAYLLDSESLSVLLSLAQTHLAAGALDQAIDVLRDAFKKEERPDVALMYSKTLSQRAKDGDLQEAIRAITKVEIANVPRLMVTSVALQAISVLSRHTDWAAAAVYLQKIEPLVDQPTVLTLTAYVQHHRGETEEALGTASRALAALEDETHALTKELLAQLLLELDQPSLAIGIFRELFERRIPTFNPRQLLTCVFRLHLDKELLAICDELHARGPIPWDILEFELQQLERYDFPKAISRLNEYLEQHPGHKLALVRLSAIGANQGMPELIRATLADLPTVEELPIEYLMPTLGILRLGPDSEHAIDYAYRYLRAHFDRREAHEALIQIVISRADRETEPDLESVLPGSAVYTEEVYSGQPRWFVLEDTDSPLNEFEEISSKDPKTSALLGKKVGDTVVLATASMGNREAVVRKILPKYVRRFQDCMAELQVRFGPSTMIQSVHIGGPNDILQPGIVSLMTSVRERAERVARIQESYAVQPMSFHLYGASLGKNAYESLQHLAVSSEATIKCFSGNPQEAETALSFLRERPGLLVDLSTVATIRLLGLEWIFSNKVHRFCMTQGTWEELRSTLIDDVVSAGPKATITYQADGYVMEEEDQSSVAQRRAEDQAFLDSLKSNIEIVPAKQLAELEHEMRDTLIKYLGQYGAETVAVSSGTDLIVWTDDAHQAEAAQALLGTKRVWTQMVLLSYVEAGVMQRDDYTRAIAKLIGMKYTSTFFDSKCMLECIRLAEYRTSRFPLRQMVEVFSTSVAPAEGLIRIFLECFVLMQQEPVLFQKRALVATAFLDALWSNPATNRAVLPLRKMVSILFGLNVIAESEFCSTFDSWFASLANRKIG